MIRSNGRRSFMSSQNKVSDKKNRTETKQKNNNNGYVNWWLFRKKGTVAEPWPTAEELWKDPKVQATVKAHNRLVKARNGS